MNVLDFIRKNSLLVLVVIFAVGVGLVMMDYSDKGSLLAPNSYIRVDGTSYSAADAGAMGENGKNFLHSLMSATRELTDRFDANADGKLDTAEQAAAYAWQAEHPEVNDSFVRLWTVYSAWHRGPSYNPENNVAINRALLRAEADRLGLHPSEQQIDNYLRAMPAFRKDDGSFNKELYRRLTGYRPGSSNRAYEDAFRSVVADIIIREALQPIITRGVTFNAAVQTKLINARSQSISGMTARLPKENIPAPAEPTEEELRAYWEQSKDKYLSPERRRISVYTLTPSADTNMENMLATADDLMQEISLADGRKIDDTLRSAADNPQYNAFTYLQENEATHIVYGPATREELSQKLTDTVNDGGEKIPLANIAFSELEKAPDLQVYEAAEKAGTEDKLVSIRQIRGFYMTEDGKQLKLVRIDAVEPPTVLPFEQAREQALSDLVKEREAQALNIAAEKLYREMQGKAAEGGLSAAFDLARQNGAAVENFGPLDMGKADTVLPDGVSDADLLGTATGKLAPLAVLQSGIRITGITRRTADASPEAAMRRNADVLPAQNEQLQTEIMQEWQRSALRRFNVLLSEQARGHDSAE